MKNILKNLGISFIHIFVFFVLQIVMSMIFMVIGCINDKNNSDDKKETILNKNTLPNRNNML